MLEFMSAYRTIVVHLDSDKRCAARREIAFGVADVFDSHLVGLYAPGLPRLPSAALAEGASVVREVEARRRKEAAAQVEREFRAAIKRGADARVEWRAAEGDALAAVKLSARYADLVILGQPLFHEHDLDAQYPGFGGEVLLSVGRPVLFIPYAGRFQSVGARVMVAWNASREAARAVSDALPFLTRAQRVEIIAFDPERGDHGEVPTADIALWLARHGVKATASHTTGMQIDIGSQILSRAADADADLIVMGGYGRSRVRELVFGGATRALLEAMTVPVLMSH
jgi:nucleotide-binding universal stress UspA family protein